MKILIITVLITGFFPYLTIISFGTDIQPWNLLFVFLLFNVLLIYKNTIYKKQIILIGIFFLATLLFFLSMDDIFSFIRSYGGYIFIVISPFVYLYILEEKFDLFVKVAKMSSFMYLFVAIIQKLLYPQFGIWFLNRISTSVTRGVTSFAPEPTFYGIIGIFFILIFDVLDCRKYIYLWIIQIIFFAQSSMAILFLLIFYLYKLLFNLKPKMFLVFIIVLFTGVILFINIDFSQYNNIRFFGILDTVKKHGLDILKLDESINRRASAIYFPIKGFLSSYGLPHGMSTYRIYLSHELPKQLFFEGIILDNRIMSFYGAILYELGVFGLIIPMSYSYYIYKGLKDNIQKRLIHLFFINTILWSAIQLSFSFIGIYFGFILFMNKKLNKELMS